MRKTLRRSCAACAKAKHSCDLRTPKCSRCLKRNSNCIYANEPLSSTITPVEDIGNGFRVLYGSKSRTESLFSIRSGGSTSADLSDLSVSLDAHLFDPFYSYPSTNLPRLRVQGLMQHFLSKIAFQYYPLDLSPSSNPFVTSWWPLALNDPALFHVTLQTASLDDELHARKGFAQSELLMKDSVSLLRQKIQDQSLAFQDATMNAVVTLAAIEHGKGNLQVSKMHIDGVKRMVTVRGGLLKVKETSPLTARMVPWVSLLVTETPQFDTQDDFGLGDGISALHQWKNGSVARWEPNILDFDALGLDPDLVNIVARLRSVFQDPLVLSATDLHDLTCFALHRLMSLPSLTSADSRSSNASTCLRVGVPAYMFIIHGATYYSHLHILNAIIIQLQCHIDTLLLSTKCENSLLVWLLSVGAVASTGTSESQWFRTQAAAISGALGFQCWHDVVRHLKRILWYETGSKILFEQTWEEILTSTSTLHSLATPEGPRIAARFVRHTARPYHASEPSGNAFREYLIVMNGWQIAAIILTVLIAYDQFMYIKNKGSIAGPVFKIPLMGPFIQALYPNFEEYKKQWASGKLSCISVFHKFVVLTPDRDLTHKIFNSPAFVKPCLVPVAEDIIGPSGWVFLHGKAHVDYRKGLNTLFTRKALECYLPTQEAVLSDYFGRFIQASCDNGGKPMPFMSLFREINCAVSCRTFVGQYISDEAVKKIADDYYCITAALELVNIPLSLYIPYTKVWKGKRAADGVLDEFAKCASKSKIHMAAGGKPTCIIDRWILSMIESKRYQDNKAAGIENGEKPSILLRWFTDFEIGQTMFTFLFASQDASSSATTYLFQIMAQRPDVLDRVRLENLEARNGDVNEPAGLQMLESMVYTNAVVKELLRYRPPVIFVPYEAKKPFPVTPTYTVPKGAMIIPSCYPALHDAEVYPQPEVFDPERWISGDANEKSRNWLVFGAGPHNCIAQQYVQLTMTAMIGKAALELDWVHHPTERSEEIKVFATLFPMDDCPLVFNKRA